jgi:choline kinase
MKVVILAAGKGSRLDNSQDHDPKALTRLENRQTILEYQLNALSSFISLDQILIVVGYQKEKIMEAFPNLLYVYNPDFEKENTAKSLLRALKKIDEDVLWINGDVIFHPSVLKNFIGFNQTSMVVNQAVVGEEEVKYRTNQTGQIIEISKTVKQPEGEALGINIYKKQDLKLLKDSLDLCANNDYFEKGIEKSIQKNQVVYPSYVESHQCAEIDFPEDLIKVNELMKTWQGG